MSINFSVLMSLYIKENPLFLEQCFISIWGNQNIKPNEIVLVLDGPIGSDLQKCLEHWKKMIGDTLVIVPLLKNIGLGKALNEGLKYCTNEWVFRMDTDDICVPNRFEQQINFIQNHPDIDVWGGQIIEFEKQLSQGKKSRTVPTSHEAIFASAKSRNPINHMTVAFKKSAVQAVGSYRHAPLFEDYDLWVRLLVADYQFANLSEVLVYARAGDAMYERRGGLAYARYEWAIQQSFYQQGFLPIAQLLKNLAIRLPVRLLPNSLRSLVYQKVLRK